jgi:hypothetical protein
VSAAAPSEDPADPAHFPQLAPPLPTIHHRCRPVSTETNPE